MCGDLFRTSSFPCGQVAGVVEVVAVPWGRGWAQRLARKGVDEGFISFFQGIDQGMVDLKDEGRSTSAPP
ncbi:hypothetical protein ACP70R_042675 [Stipagrostis hirtigluma subsp. patula]